MSQPIITNQLRLIPRDEDFLNRKLGSRGEVYFDQDNNTLRLYDADVQGGVSLAKNDLSNISNSDFLTKATAAGVGSAGVSGSTTVTVGTTLPESPENGNLWLNTNNGVLYVYINDGDTLQWIQPSVPIAGLENYVTNDRLGNIDFNNNIITSGDSSAISFAVPVTFNSSATFNSITSGSIIIADDTISTDDSSKLNINVPTDISNISINNNTISTVDDSVIIIRNFVFDSSTITTDDSSAVTITPSVVLESSLLINDDVTVSGDAFISSLVIKGTSITSDDSSEIVFEPPVKMQSNLTVENDLLVLGTISGYIDLAELQTVVAASSDFDDFKSRIASL